MTVIHSCQMCLYCTSLVFHIWLNGPLYLLSLNGLTRFLRLKRTNWEKDETLWLFMLICNNFFLDEATNQKERETFLAEPVFSLKLVRIL